MNETKRGIEYYTEVVAKMLPLLTVLTFVFGYIGFHTFTTIYHLPVINPDITTIASIGALNITYFGILYLTATVKRKPFYFESLLIYFSFHFFLGSPKALASILVVQLVIYHNIMPINSDVTLKRITFTERKLKVRKRQKFRRRLDMLDPLISTLAAILIFLFQDVYFYNIVIAIYIILYFIHQYKRHKLIPSIFKISIVLLFPIVTMYYFVNSSNTNVLGINKYRVDMITKKDTLKTNVIFNDANYFYTFSDSTKIMTMVRKDEVVNVFAKSEKEDVKSALVVYKEFFKEYFGR